MVLLGHSFLINLMVNKWLYVCSVEEKDLLNRDARVFSAEGQAEVTVRKKKKVNSDSGSTSPNGGGS